MSGDVRDMAIRYLCFFLVILSFLAYPCNSEDVFTTMSRFAKNESCNLERDMWYCHGTIDIPYLFENNMAELVNYTLFDISFLCPPELIDIPIVFVTSDEDICRREYLEKIYDARIEPGHPLVNSDAIRIAGKYSGELTIEQICALYDYLKFGDGSVGGWSYVSDPRDIDIIRYANETIRIGKEIDRSGVGDCDDFAIVMSSFIESIGGTSRIVLAYNNTSGHAYAEVYLGNISDQETDLNNILNWIKYYYNINNVYTHIHSVNCEEKEVWLNLDWGQDENGNYHPGGPFYKGDEHIILQIREGAGSRSTVKASKVYLPQNQFLIDLV